MPTLPFSLRPLIGALSTALLLAAGGAQAQALSAQRVWQYDHAATGVAGQKAEIVAFDAATDTLWVAGVKGVDVLSRSTGTLLQHIDVTGFGAINSVAIHGGLAAFAIENTSARTSPGSVVFFDTATRTQSGAALTVGALPDMLTFTPDGRRVLVANEGTPTAGQAVDPVGSVSIVDVASRSVSTLNVDASISGHDTLRAFPAGGATATRPAFPAQDAEPEYIAVDPSGTRAYVGLQEANGLAVLNLQTNSFEKIVNLGLKDFSLPGNAMDPHDQDGRRELRSAAVRGLYQPDGIAAYASGGKTFLVMANEGDSREDGLDERRGSAGNAAVELVPEGSDLSRLTLSNVESVRGDLVTFGGRSFSIRDAEGQLIYDSGNLLDAEAIARGLYDDGRSDNKGVEPEGVALLVIGGRTYAFIGLERTTTAATAVFDVSDPTQVSFIDFIVGQGDLAPEGLTGFEAGGRHYLAVANEAVDGVAGTTSLFVLTPVPEPSTYALMAGGLLALGAVARRRKA